MIKHISLYGSISGPILVSIQIENERDRDVFCRRKLTPSTLLFLSSEANEPAVPGRATSRSEIPLDTHNARSHTIPFMILVVIYILVKAVVMQHRVQVPVQPQLVQSALNKLAEAVREPALLVARGARPRRAGACLCAKRDALGSAPSTL